MYMYIEVYTCMSERYMYEVEPPIKDKIISIKKTSFHGSNDDFQPLRRGYMDLPSYRYEGQKMLDQGVQRIMVPLILVTGWGM